MRNIRREKWKPNKSSRICSEHFTANCGGWNNNPNQLQFKWALKKLILKNSVLTSRRANCLDLDLEHESDSLFAFITSSRRVGIQRPEYDETFSDILDNEEADLIGAAFLRTGTSVVQDNILYYIAGFILRKMSKFLLE
jgi:hypothetical protein